MIIHIMRISFKRITLISTKKVIPNGRMGEWEGKDSHIRKFGIKLLL